MVLKSFGDCYCKGIVSFLAFKHTGFRETGCVRGVCVCVCRVQREGIRSCSSQAFLQYVGTRTVLQITERSASSRRFSPVRPVVIGRLIKEEERRFFEESVPQLDRISLVSDRSGVALRWRYARYVPSVSSSSLTGFLGPCASP